jgi:hypothetical protein
MFNTHDILVHDGTVARVLQVPRLWVREMAERKDLPCIKAGDKYLFDLELTRRTILEIIHRGNHG